MLPHRLIQFVTTLSFIYINVPNYSTYLKASILLNTLPATSFFSFVGICVDAAWKMKGLVMLVAGRERVAEGKR